MSAVLPSGTITEGTSSTSERFNDNQAEPLLTLVRPAGIAAQVGAISPSLTPRAAPDVVRNVDLDQESIEGKAGVVDVCSPFRAPPPQSSARSKRSACRRRRCLRNVSSSPLPLGYFGEGGAIAIEDERPDAPFVLADGNDGLVS